MTTELKARADGTEAPPDRVRAHSNRLQSQRIDARTQQCLRRYAPADREAISRHVGALNREWDVERNLQMNGDRVVVWSRARRMVSRRFLVLPAVLFGFFFQHATQGWCPSLPVFRKTGVRTPREINQEKLP
jgi:hypothetical protein